MKARDFDYVRRAVHFLKKHGCLFAVDDVAGIGSKFFLLLSLKPDFLKIDISLGKGISKSRLQQGLLRRVLEISHKNGCKVIAEGIENKKDLDYIREMGISFVQGFYFSRPRKTLFVFSKPT
jgi:EAL domain-containing protein (putative c-di-GMP-specific phosphodiesterase class I)